jgi:CheY-like chemotaxis protein
MSDVRVLVIEDNIIHITLLMEQLTVGMEIPESNITCAYCGDEAIKELENNIILNQYDPTS